MIIKCKNCNEDTGVFPGDTRNQIHWCGNCGTLLFFDEKSHMVEEWYTPKSVEKTKQLATELVKARDKQGIGDLYVQIANKKEREQFDNINWDSNER